MKVFISQPMNGKTHQEIYDERCEVINELVIILKKDYIQMKKYMY